MANRYPDFVMETLRQRLDLEADDTSRDYELNMYSPSEAFEEMLNWEGILGYADTIKYWIESIYGIDLDTIEVENPTETEPYEFTCNDCPYFYADEEDEPARCHYHGEDRYAPCNYEEPEEPYDYDDEE